MERLHQGTKKGPFFSMLENKLCKRLKVLEDPNDIVEEMDIPFYPLLLRALLS